MKLKSGVSICGINVFSIATAALFLFTIGCSNNLLEERRRTHAPTSAQDTGVVLSNFTPQQVRQILNDNPGAQFRELNKAHGLYEIFGAKPQSIKAGADQQVIKNDFFKNEWNKLESVPLPNGLQVANWPLCVESAVGPTAALKFSEPEANLDMKTYVGRTRLRATNASKSNSGGGLRRAFLVVPPSSSGLTEQWIFEDSLDVDLNALGMYTVAVVVQDENDACAIEGTRFLITDNRPFKPSSGGTPLEKSQFTHLSMVDAEPSWNVSQGEGVIVAVIDSGVSYNNPSIADAILTNDKDSVGNDSDDDGNGIKDDELGYDFINDDPYPFDDDGHGTHVAGLIAAREFGLAPKAKILAVKAVSSFGGDFGSISAAIIYAVDRGAKVLNLSLGGPQSHPLLDKALAYAKSKGVIAIVAAGNGDENGVGFDIDQTPVFPASTPGTHILTVGAYDHRNVLSPYSNFGKQSVDIVAPGGYVNDFIMSLAYENPSGLSVLGLAGTSMATPQVSGVAAQILSLRPSLSPEEVKAIILENGNAVSKLVPYTVSGRTLSAAKAVMKAQSLN